MSNCNCKNQDQTSTVSVPDFAVVGFTGATAVAGQAKMPALDGGLALQRAVCAGASYNSGTNQICFTVPVYGDFCVTSPITIPASAAVKACVETCGSIIPTGLRASIYVNNQLLFT